MAAGSRSVPLSLYIMTTLFVKISSFQPVNLSPAYKSTLTFTHHGGSSGAGIIISNVNIPYPKNNVMNFQQSNTRTRFTTRQLSTKLSDEELNQIPLGNGTNNNVLKNPLVLLAIAILYWYLLVFGLLVPDFVPMVPGWPPSDQDLVPVIEDSIHFFYISDALDAFSSLGGGGGGGDGSLVSVEQSSSLPPLRLAFFNFAEAWVFAFLPLLLADKKRLPLPVVLGTWLGALGLTNAFLAPYLALRQFFDNNDDNDVVTPINSKFLNLGFGTVSSLVVGFALFQTLSTTATSPDEWRSFLNLVKTDRTYLAFAVDLVLFTCFQSLLLQDQSTNEQFDSVGERSIPSVSLVAWLFK